MDGPGGLNEDSPLYSLKDPIKGSYTVFLTLKDGFMLIYYIGIIKQDLFS